MKRSGDRWAEAARLVRALPLCVLGLAQPSGLLAQDDHRFTLEVEGGPVWQSRNDVQIPNDPSGTRFSLRDLTGSGPWAGGRVYLSWAIDERNELRVLAAPLAFAEVGVLDRRVDFADASYQPGTATEGTYEFNSYRVTYRRRVHQGDAWTWHLGFTAKIRDALIELHQGEVTSRKKDLGFVPLLHVASDWRFADRWHAISDIDALAGGPGRAEDVALKLRYDLGPRLAVAAGYRTVEGGADVDSVFTFAWLHFAVMSLTYRM